MHAIGKGWHQSSQIQTAIHFKMFQINSIFNKKEKPWPGSIIEPSWKFVLVYRQNPVIVWVLRQKTIRNFNVDDDFIKWKAKHLTAAKNLASQKILAHFQFLNRKNHEWTRIVLGAISEWSFGKTSWSKSCQFNFLGTSQLALVDECGQCWISRADYQILQLKISNSNLL